MKRAIVFAGLAAALAVLSRSAGAKPANTMPASTIAGVAIRDAISHPALRGGTGVLYATFVARDADVLIGVSSPLAARGEVHESTRESRADRGAMPGMGTTARMEPVARLPLSAGAVVRFAPGGYHVMLLDLRRPLVAGMRIPVVFRFARAGAIATTAVVKAF